ncbi:RDD family protein [Knoellia subterranea]|uniref:RDD family protein n=1 Tax=Knoellia subterranea KCTC 19937 TaxID=1385521 RepID=A0A0A0JVC7_9MICO|nr:RDD family protein [Knoellia subterranea]KGN39581.1 hypothetical protein N803_01700 [Knoellia subterranea KCTC 19937]
MSTPSSPGWYENPDNPEELRYFDGILWTANTTPLRKRPMQQPASTPAEHGSAAAAPSAPPAAPSPPASWPGQQPPQQNPYERSPHQNPHQHQNPYGQPAHTPGLPGQVALAPYGLRVVAYIVDSIVVAFLSLIFGGYFLWQAISPVLDRFDSAMASGNVDEMSAAIAEARLGWLAAFLGIQLLILLGYQVLCLTRWGATPGKLMVGISVRRLDRPGPLDTDTAVRRAGFQAVVQALGNVPVLSLFGTIAVILDLVWPLADDRRQALHDKVAKTIVIKGRAQR